MGDRGLRGAAHRGTRPPRPAEAWRRIKEIRHLRSSALAIAQAVAAWREEKAIELDQTPRFILSDLGVVGVAGSAPTTVDELRALRGVDGRNLRGGMAEELLVVVRNSKDLTPTKAPASNVPEMPGELRPAVPLVSAWVSQRARDLELETSLLATRSDLEDLLRGVPECPSDHGVASRDRGRAHPPARRGRGRARVRPPLRAGARGARTSLSQALRPPARRAPLRWR